MNYLFSSVNALPLAVFRLILVGALALHFLPAVFHHGDNYDVDAPRVPIIFREFGITIANIPGFVQITHIFFVAALTGALTLRFTRLFFLLIVGCLYVYLSVNALNTNTLGIWPALNICTLFAVFPSGNPRYRLSEKYLPFIDAGETPRLLPLLILIQVFGAFFFAGLEKLLAGWHVSNAMKEFLALPPGSVVRPWVYEAFPAGVSPFFSTLLTVGTFAAELLLPLLLFWRRIRIYTVIVYEIFFVAVICVLDVPPLFYLVFAGGGIVAAKI